MTDRDRTSGESGTALGPAGSDGGTPGDTPSSGPTLREWLADRTPPVPAPFAEHVRPDRPESPAGVESLVTEASRAADRALGREPADRRAAFELLAADAFATWAAEAALDRGDPDATLEWIIRELQRRAGTSG